MVNADQAGSDCIQGLRWPFMQIYSASIAEYPKSGELVLVDSGFRYFAKQDFAGTESFTLIVAGKILRDEVGGTVTGRSRTCAKSVAPKENRAK
jgi:hypothetical protein